MVKDSFHQLDQLCEQAQELLGRYQWSLVDAYELADRAAELLSCSDGHPSAAHACLQAYAAELHRVIQGDDRELLEQAFTELWHYLWPVARNKVGAKRADEFAQRALVIVWEKRTKCRRPASFFNWATIILINEIRQDYRNRTRPTDAAETKETGKKRAAREITMTDLVEQDDEREAFRATGIGQVEDELLREEALQQLLQALHDALPGANQVAVIVALFLEERNPAEIAAEMNCTVQYVYVQKSRAMKRLRGDPAVIAALQDLVMTYPENA